MVRFLVAVVTLICLTLKSSEEAPITKATDCESHCGDVRVPFPFGIGPGCSVDDE
ncbi:hypothetical protein TIFTF001_024469 [Ficus carica]|uniref:Uncharacterized protein n=1 Tax=Ficus carica TaxID=3494 RepID=A0AA88DG31_FICCA|nr:hypothetical protein TIFTF001_024469 [Ficus carica]